MHLVVSPHGAELSSFQEGGQAHGPSIGPEDAGAPLPVEIGFLAQHGFPVGLLRYAAAQAARLGVDADTFMIAHGLIDETTFYRALADELGVPFLPRPEVGAHASYPASILSGFAPLASRSPRWAAAPAGPGLVRLLMSRRAFGEGLAITTPQALAHAVIAARADGIADAAAHRLPDQAPLVSYRGQLTHAQAVALVALFLVLLLALVDGGTFDVASLALGPLFLAMVGLRLAAALQPPRAPSEPARAADGDLPVYTVIVALYREARVLPQLVSALQKIDYPPSKLDIKLVLEEGDRETRDALAALPLPGFFQVLLAPAGHPQTKPRALNVALPLIRGEYTAVYDAEDLPDPRQLRWAVARFSALGPDVACLLARLSIYNPERNGLTRLFAIEYAALFDVMNPGLMALGQPILLGGSSNHFRTEVLRVGCGWDAWNVTEDADLSVRLARAGFKTADLPLHTAEDAPETFRMWWRQRSRWMKGFMQTCITHSREPLRTYRQLGPGPALSVATLTLGTVFSALGFPVFVALIALGFADGSLLNPRDALEAAGSYTSLALFAGGAAAMLVPPCVALVRRRLWGLLPWVLALPLYYALVSLAAWRGLWELIVAPSHWHKTDHRQARAVAPCPARPAQGRAKAAASDPSRPPRARG